VCNLSLMVGDRFFGWRGAFAALAGMMLLPMVVMLALAWLVALTPPATAAHDAVRGALWGITAVAGGQIIGTVLKLAAPLREHPLGLPAAAALALAAFLMMTWVRWPLVWVLFGLGVGACAWTYLVLRKARTAS
jgi:chromate transporter